MTKQDLIKEGQELFANHPRLKVYVGPVKQVIDTFANNLLSLIRDYRHENEISVSDMFIPNDNAATPATSVTYEQFLDVLREAKIPFPKAMINDIMKHLVSHRLSNNRNLNHICLLRDKLAKKALFLSSRRRNF